MARSLLLAAAAALIGASAVRSCVHLMGDAPNSLAEHTGSHWTYAWRGRDWEGVTIDKASWVCKTGTKQSPINLVTARPSNERGQASLRTQWSYSPLTSNGSNIEVFNNGHTIQVQPTADLLVSDVRVPTRGNVVTDVVNPGVDADEGNSTFVTATPLQFHFHTDSEHAYDGVNYPLELHIVHSIAKADLPGCPDKGCYMVTGILFKLDDNDKDNAALEAIWSVMPEREGLVANLPDGAVLDIEALLPGNDSRSYFQYEGSLTTPPCSEGLLWHVFATPATLSLAQLEKYQRAVGLKECVLRPGYAASAADGGRRRMLDSDIVEAFVRGSYAGFTHASQASAVGQDVVVPATVGPRRALLQEQTPVNPEAYDCKVVSFGYTNRAIQGLHNRTVLVYA